METVGGTVTFVRPGQTALRWLADRVGAARSRDAFAPILIVVPNYNAGRFALRSLARESGCVNVHASVMVQLANEILGPLGVTERLTAVIELSAVRAALLRSGGVLGTMADKRALQRSLARLFRELRQSETRVDELPLDTLGQTAVASIRVFRRFRELTASYADPTELRDAATRVAANPSHAEDVRRAIGTLIVYLPTRLDPADVRLLAALARVVPLHAALPWVDDREELANTHAVDEATALASALAAEQPTSPTVEDHLTCNVIRAPDVAEELREIVRRVCADLESGIPLHHVAVLYRQGDPYARAVREALDLAELPWMGIDGRRLSDTAPGRALLTTLRLIDRRFAREAVLAWVDTGPSPATRNGLRTSQWDRVSRKANVVRGSGQWASRLEGFARTAEQAADQADLDGAEALGRMHRREARDARTMAEVVTELATHLESPPAGGRWTDLVDWANHLVETQWHSGDNDLDERARELVEETLEELRSADRYDSDQPVALSRFVDTLEAELADRTITEGRLGNGVLVGPVQATMGLAFDRVYFVGMVEGAFPPAPPADPFFPIDALDPTGRRQRQRAADRRAFLTAIAQAEPGGVTLSTPESLAGRAAYPSHWLLAQAHLQVEGRVSGRFLDAAAFRLLSEAAHPWLRVVHSSQDGVQRAPTPADLEDRRIAEAAGWRSAGFSVARHPLGARGDLPIGAGLATSEARWSPAFTVYDGNVRELAASSTRLRRFLEGEAPTSASAIQTWATCPFRYFMSRVLYVEPTERPGDEWAINALEKGSLVHGVLEKFFLALAVQGRPLPTEGYNAEDLRLMTTLAEEHFAALEARGVTGHPIVWEGTRRALLADLRTFLVEDERWRHGGWRPMHFEQTFGMGKAESWAAVEIPVAGGVIRVRGVVDRVDVSLDGRRAHVFDYKTGNAGGYSKLAEDPVLAGTALQLALYGQAVSGRLGGDVSVGADYWFVSEKGKFARRGVPDARAIETRLYEVTNLIARGVSDGVFPAVPGGERLESYDNCAYCAYDRVCVTGRDQSWERKQLDGCHTFIDLTPTS